MAGRQKSTADLYARAWEHVERTVDERIEVTYLRAGSDPPWERPHLDGVDVTDHPEICTPYQRARRSAFEARVERYRSVGLIP